VFAAGTWVTFGYVALDRVGLLELGSGRMRSQRVVGAFDVAWSPDGRRIAVTVQNAIVLLTTHGRVVRRIPIATKGGSWLNGVTWSPDGRQLAYSEGGTIFTVDVDGGRDARRVVVGGKTIENHAPDWRP
jgi:Tol biopolymer transport system component